MKIYSFSLPILLSFFLISLPSSNVSTLEHLAINKKAGIEGLFQKKGGPLVATQDFSNCNKCANCSAECLNSEDSCSGATISINSIFCPEYSPIANISFPGNEQYICSLTQTGPYSWYLEFNVNAFSCDQPGIPFMFDIPVVLDWVCPTTATNTTSTTLNYIIC